MPESRSCKCLKPSLVVKQHILSAKIHQNQLGVMGRKNNLHLSIAGKPKKFGAFCLPHLHLENCLVGLPVRGLAIRGLAL